MNPFKITVITSIISAALFIPMVASAAKINNGNFQTADFSSWSQDVDGFGAPISGLDDFSIVEQTSGNYAARIGADYWSTPGDTFSTAQNEAYFASTLYQELDLSAAAGDDLVISFDWNFSGEGSLSDENFLVALSDGSGNYYGADGNLGFLLNPVDYGYGFYAITLDSSFNNASGWALEFQLNTGFDGLGSNIIVDDVKLSDEVNLSTVPVPASFWFLGSAFAGLIGYQRKKRQNA